MKIIICIWKINKFVWDEKIGYLIIFFDNDFFHLFVNNFSKLLLCMINVLVIFNIIDDFLKIFCCYIAKYCNSDRIKLLVGIVTFNKLLWEMKNDPDDCRHLRGVSEKYPTCVYIFAPEHSSGLCGVWA